MRGNTFYGPVCGCVSCRSLLRKRTGAKQNRRILAGFFKPHAALLRFLADCLV